MAPTQLAAPAGIWQVGRVLALVGLNGVLVGLWTGVGWAPRVLWNGLVPALPALLLVHPGLWRNICPFATVGMAVGSFGAGRRRRGLPPRVVAVTGAALPLFLIAARAAWLENDPRASALVLTVMAGGAATGGLFLDRKAGFCNLICPMLPIEPLYGQRPLISLRNDRCPTCTACSARGCIDLAPKALHPPALRPRTTLRCLASDAVRCLRCRVSRGGTRLLHRPGWRLISYRWLGRGRGRLQLGGRRDRRPDRTPPPSPACACWAWPRS